MTRLLRLVAALSLGLGVVLALPGLLLLIGAAQIGSLLVDREQERHAAELFPPDLAHDSEPR
jgi:hypothetical protein